jgi:hypothetical protein
VFSLVYLAVSFDKTRTIRPAVCLPFGHPLFSQVEDEEDLKAILCARLAGE